ncbi:MAG: DUF5010 C-terminal domain-containing protein [Prevotellaceae bacterium]|nr:DUF5010 C-terminal domain-containing protein [Prevotellaceae bacterium]
MKNIFINLCALLSVFCIFAFISCSGDDDKQQITEEPELPLIILDDVIGRAGIGRIQISFSVPNNTVKKVTIVNKNTNGTTEIAINNKRGNVETVFDNLPEGTYFFSLTAFDDSGNSSTPVEVIAKSYGQGFLANLRAENRRTKSVTALGNGVGIIWSELYGDEIKFSHKDLTGKDTVTISTGTKYSSFLCDYEAGVKYQTGIRPEPTAIDIIYLEPQALIASSNKIPVFNSTDTCVIVAGDFDFGGEGVGFYDASKRSNYNAYRVEMGDEQCSAIDIPSNGNIQNITANEWLAYTVIVQDDGVYEFDANLTVNGNNNTVHLMVDGRIYPSFPLMNNYSWTTYYWHFELNAIEKPTVNLTAGKHKIVFGMEAVATFYLHALKFIYKEPL